jgi:hypothetical protein
MTKIGRPKKYKTEEERKEAKRISSQKYEKKTNYSKKNYIKDPIASSARVKKSISKKPQKYKNYQVKYRENNKDALEIKRKLYDTKKIQHALAEWKIGNPEPFWNLRLPFIKGRAKQQKLPFNLTTENMTELTYRQRFLCYYTNFLLISFAGKGAKSKSIEERMHTLSIDKMDPLKGYTINNVVLVSDFINTMKLNLTNHEFLTLINTIVRQFAGKEVSYNRIHKFYNTNQKKFKKFKNIITNKKNIQKMVKNVFLGRKEAREYYPDIKSFEDIRKKF